MYQPKTEYQIYPDKVDIRDFHAYRGDFVVRPPYQRKNVWSRKKQQALLDSLFRRYYVPKLVLREVRLSDDRVVREVVDGQQRIVTVQRFFEGALALPKSLKDLDSRFPGLRHSELPTEVRKFVDKDLKFDVDLIRDIDDPQSANHQRVATEIFWRLQQGESLNFMEVAHARLASLVRNYLVKYADDISFNYDRYEPVDTNPFKHRFFTLIERNNDRMQHLALLGRLLMIEKEGGATDIRDSQLSQFVDDHQRPDGIGDESFEVTSEGKNLLRTLDLFAEIFDDDPMIDESSGVKELRIEYFIISMVMLLMHLRRHYAFESEHFEVFRRFIYNFHDRWKRKGEDDRDILLFSDNRQQSKAELELRDRIVRQNFFEYLRDAHIELPVRDRQRLFDEAQRIRIYREQDGMCQICKAEGLSDEEARVSWSEYQADHIFPWIRGGKTEEWNGQLLCTAHNAAKGAQLPLD